MTALSAFRAAPGGTQLPPPVCTYLAAVLEECERQEVRPVSLVLFGSAAQGAFTEGISDVDLLLVLADDATAGQRQRLRAALVSLEELHALRAPRARPATALEAFLDRAGGNIPGAFVCSRGDLLSGEVARVFGLGPLEALLVDRIVFASIITSAVTCAGEDLLPYVPVPPVRRLDLFKALLGTGGQVLLCAAAFPLLREATRYAIGALKHSLHGCYFCYHGTTAPLAEEADFFRRRSGGSRTLEQLLTLRRRYRRSWLFVVRCVPTLLRLHWRTARDNRFPIRVVRPR